MPEVQLFYKYIFNTIQKMAQTQMALPPKLMEMQRTMEAETNEIKKIETEYQKLQINKRSMQEKKSENEMVMQELNLLEDGKATVYKLVGPVLAKIDTDEAKTNVKTRLDYIGKEIDRMDVLEKEFTGNVEDKRKTIMSLQNQFRSEAQKM